MPKKVLLFTYSLNIGGAQRMTLHLANQMAANGLEVYLAVCRGGKGELRKDADERVRVIDMGVAGNTFFTLPGFTHLMGKIQPDATLAALPNINLVAIWARRLSGAHTRLVVSERNHLTSQITHNRQLSARLRPWLYRAFYPWADTIVAVCKVVADDLANRTGIAREKVRVIYNPAFSPEISRRARQPVAHPWLNHATTPVVLTVGRLHPQKDQETLLRAFRQVVERQPARLILLGEGPLRQHLQNKAKELGINELVDMPGKVTNPYAFMARAKTFALSSAWEGFPNVLVEALACGTPVVATDCPGGCAEILEYGRYGTLTPVGDAEALAQALLNTLKSRVNKDKLIKRAEDFSAEKAFAQYREVLEI